MLYSDQLEKEITSCNKETQELRHLTEYLHTGSFYTQKNGIYVQNKYYSADGTDIYIPKKERALARELAVRRDFNAQIEDLHAHSRMYTAALDMVNSLPHAQEAFRSQPGMQQLLEEACTALQETGTFYTADEYKKHGKPAGAVPAREIRDHISPESFDSYVRQWLCEPYGKNPNYQTSLKYTTYDDEPMRSKNEMLYADILKRYQFPYRYEMEHIFSGVSYHPDFTLMHPRDHYIIIVELFGLMSNPRYREQAGHKVHVYMTNGFDLNKTLFCYCESEDSPMDFHQMKKDIEYLLHR